MFGNCQEFVAEVVPENPIKIFDGDYYFNIENPLLVWLLFEKKKLTDIEERPANKSCYVGDVDMSTFSSLTHVLWLFYHVTQQDYWFSVERIKTSQINSLKPSQNIVPTCFPSFYNELPKTFVKQGGSLCCLKIIAHKIQYRVDAEVKNVCNAYCKLVLTITHPVSFEEPRDAK